MLLHIPPASTTIIDISAIIYIQYSDAQISPSKKKEYCKSAANHLLWKGVGREK